MRSASQQQGGGSIMSRNNKEDDEDELEALRLAALESLRAKGLPPPVVLKGQRVSPKPNVCNNAIFQRHFGNQNLIAIIPVENSSANSSPYHNSPPHNPPLLDSKLPPIKNVTRPPLLKNPSMSSVPHNSSVEEKPKSNKFSRFEDSDSDDSDDVEMSYAKSESEEEEFVIEEGDAEDLIIEVEDEIIDEEETNGVAELPTAPVPEDQLSVNPSVSKPIDNSASPSTNHNTSPYPSKVTMADTIKEGPTSRDTKIYESSRKIDAVEFARQSPQLRSSASQSPNLHSRRRSSPRQQKSPQRLQKSSPRTHRSPPRSQRSPVRIQRSPVRIQRSPLRVQRSPQRIQRSPTRIQRSPPRRSPPRSSDRDKPKHRDSSRTGSGSDRSGTDEAKKTDRTRTAIEIIRSSDQRRAKERSRSPIGDRKPPLKKSPSRSVPSDRDARKIATTSLTEVDRDRLESRKRKFETAVDQESSVKKEGKIRLRTESRTSPVQPTRREEKPKKVVEAVAQIQVKRDEPISLAQDKTVEESVERKSKKSKRSSKKSKEKSHNGKTQPSNDEDSVLMKLPSTKSSETSDAHLDLRAELQRRRGHRYEDDEEPRSRTPDTRRILVLNSPPSSTAVVAPSKPTTEPTGVLSKHQRLVSEGQTKPGTSVDSLPSSKRNGSVKLKRTLLATPIEIDQGPETDSLEDRIRLIRAQNELIRKRQREIEADKLQYS